MKFSLLFTILFGLTATANGYSQSNISITMAPTSLREVLDQIKNVSKANILYDVEQTSAVRVGAVDIRDKSVGQTLDEVLRGTGFRARVIEGAYVISPAPAAAAQQPASYATVTGSVYDEQGRPLPGATVIVKGTTVGASADANGKFTLRYPASTPDPILSVSFLGMSTVDMPVDGRPEYKITLKDDKLAIEDVVVTGYFERKRDSYTGAATTYKAEELRTVSNQNLLSTLSMLDPTFKMVENNELGSDPNSIPDFEIRGAGSIRDIEGNYSNSPNMPTFILDGFEVSATKVFDLDPNIVSSITILKDAAATAIYGSRAANGVVVIETKLPEAGGIKASYNVSVDFDVADLSDYDLMNASEKLLFEEKARLYDWNKYIYIWQDYQDAYNQRLAMLSKGYDTDWIAKPVRKLGVAHKHTLMVEGGDERFRYSINANYNNTVGVMKGSDRNRVGIGASFQYNWKNLKFSNNITFDHVNYKNSPYGSFSQYTLVNPYLHPYDEAGNITDVLITEFGKSFSERSVYNPLYNAKLNSKDEGKYDNFINNFSFEWQIVPGLRLTSRLSIDRKTTVTDLFKDAKDTSFYGKTDKGSYTKSTAEDTSFDGNAVLSYTGFFDRHMLIATGVYNIRQTKSDMYGTTAWGYPNSNMDHIGMGVKYLEGTSPSGDEALTRLMGFVGNFNYSYDQRYLLDLSVRTDASSLFGADKRWGTFGSVGVGWNIHNERFLKDAPWVSLLKLRGSWGLTGGQNFYAYQALMTYSYSGEVKDITYNDQLGALVKAFGNNDLKWQKNEKFNVGVDFELFNRRLMGSVNYYSEISRNMLVDVTMAPSLGFSTYKENLGKIKNSGLELNLRSNLIADTERQILWNVFFNATFNRNKLLEINEALRAYNDKSDEATDSKPRVRYMTGESINTIWVNKSLGIDPQTGREVFLDLNGNMVNEWSAANYMPLGCTDPKLEGNFGTTFGYKGFQVSLYFKYLCGAQTYNQTLVDKVENIDPYFNADRRALYDRWQNPGDHAAFKSIADSQTTKPTSRFLEDYSYLNCTSINISYQFDSHQLKRIGLDRLKISLLGNDVFRFDTVKQERGISYPFARHYSIMIQTTF